MTPDTRGSAGPTPQPLWAGALQAQRWDTVYWKREITYLRDLERLQTHALPCLGL